MNFTQLQANNKPTNNAATLPESSPNVGENEVKKSV